MRAALCLAWALTGCLVSERSMVCGESERCEPPHVEAPFVLGKADADSNSYTHGMNHPAGVTVIEGMLFVADRDNHRILAWKTWPSRSYQPPDLVIGQRQLSVLEAGASNSTLVSPLCLTGDAARLIVGTDLPTQSPGADQNRLLQFKLPLIRNFPTVEQQLNVGIPGSMAQANNFAGPSPVLIGAQLFVADRGFHRALVWESGSFWSQGSQKVLGQADLTSGALSSTTAISLNSPQGCPTSDGNQPVIPDTGNHRVLIYDAITTNSMNRPPAKIVLGQISFVANQPNQAGIPSLATLSSPMSAAAAVVGGNRRLVVADRDNNRVLLWDSLTDNNGSPASRALGQGSGSGVAANAGGVSMASLWGPTAVYTDGERIAVADTENHRVLLWNRWPQVNARPADIVLGQPNGTQNRNLGHHATASSFLNTYGLARVGEGLAVADRGFNRVLIYPTLPRSPSDVPTLVLGQPDMTSSATYGGAGGPVANGLYVPSRVASDGRSLAVLDGFGALSRILIWSLLPTVSQQPPDGLLGKPSFTDLFGDGDVQSEFSSDADLALFGGRIYLADGRNSRVLIWRSLPTRINQRADVVLGQTSLQGILANQGRSVGRDTLSTPRGLFVDEGHLYVSDSGNHRILVWNTNDPSTNQPADRVIGQADFNQNQGCVPGRLCSPQTLSIHGNRLYVTETSSHRVLSWPSVSPQVGEPPDTVYGQPDLSTSSPNLGRLAIDRLNAPQSILATDRGIYIGDAGNGRVVVLPPVAP